MTPDDFNRFCGALPHTTHVVQWGGAQVWKVGGKLFAAMWDGAGKNAGITFKVPPASYDILSGQPGLRPAPYLASRGIRWIQRFSDESMSDEDLRAYLRQSHALVLDGLPKKQRAALAAGS
jgi:predicted DNA-binding protein (MmcQ/YjbR family)